MENRVQFSYASPEDPDVLRLTTLVAQRVQSLLERRGLSTNRRSRSVIPYDPGMAVLLASSVNRRIAVGSNAGRGVVRLGDQIGGDSLDAFESPRCAMVSGFSVHANVCIEARDYAPPNTLHHPLESPMLLVEFARPRQYQKRGGGAPKTSLDEALIVSPQRGPEVVALDDALQALAASFPRQAR